MSRLARIATAHGLMHDVDFTIDDGSGDSKDLWWRYRNYPYLKEAIAIGLFMTGKSGKGMEQLTDVLDEYVSFGILSKLIPLNGPFDEGKNYGYKVSEGLYDVATSGALPVPWRQFATRMVDPVMRRSRKIESLGYEAGPLDAIKLNTPGLSKTVPSGGRRQRAAFAPFSAKDWFKEQTRIIPKLGTPAADKIAEMQHWRQQAAKLDMSPEDQREFFRLAGLPVEKMNMTGSSISPSVRKIQRLQALGVGNESFGAVQRVDKRTGKTITSLTIPDPASVGYQPRGLQALRFFGGVNLMAVPRRKIARDEEVD
jgi:hypothetical protein